MFCQSCLIRKNICFIKSFSLLFATPDEVLFCNIISNNHVQYMSQNGKAKGEKVNHVSSKKQLFDGKPFSARGLVNERRQEAKTVAVPTTLTIVSTLHSSYL